MRVGDPAKRVSGTQQDACETTAKHGGNHERMPLAARNAARSSSCPREVSPDEPLETQAGHEVDLPREPEPVPDQKPPGLWFAVTDSELDELVDEGLLEFAWHRGPADGPGCQLLLEVPVDEVGEVERGPAPAPAGAS